MQDEEIQSAYRELGLAPGSPWSDIEEKFKFLVMSFHPDRASAKNKEMASASLKKVNHARDILKAHFKSNEHDDSPYCRCRRTSQPAGTEASKNSGTSGSAPAGTSNSSSSSARSGASSSASQPTGSKKADSSSQSQASKQTNDSANANSSSPNNRSQAKYSHSTTSSQSDGYASTDSAKASSPPPPPAPKPLRQPQSTTPTPNPFAKLTARQKTIGLTAIAGLLVWGHFDHQAQDEREAREKAAEAARAKAEYDRRPHYKWVPGQAEAQAKEAQEAEIEASKAQAASEQYKQKLTRAGEEVDRYQKSIAQNEKNIAALDAALAAGNLNTAAKQSLLAELDMRTKDLSANRASLKAAQEALSEILKSAPPKASN